MTPSSREVAENVQRHAAGMAAEIARRVAENAQGKLAITPTDVERIALIVLLDWYLGDFIPNNAEAKPDDDRKPD
jgi:hypothetical protein